MFVAHLEASVVRNLSIQDICKGRVGMPFNSRAAWHTTQLECPDLRHTHAHLMQGTRPSKKMTKIPDVKRHLQSAIIASDGLLIVLKNVPFQCPRERIAVPRSVVHSLFTALPIRFSHPSVPAKTLDVKVFLCIGPWPHLQVCLSGVSPMYISQDGTKRVDVTNYINTTRMCWCVLCPGCYATLQAICVIILVKLWPLSHFNTALISSEKHQDLREAILILCTEVRCLGIAGVHICINPAPGLTALKDDPTLQQYVIIY